jgi:hypothetical protein
MADPLQSPMTRLGCRFVCTTSGFAQKNDARPVGGRGISAFSDVFFLAARFFATVQTNDLDPAGRRYERFANGGLEAQPTKSPH